jgi:hypothetical protein
MNFKLQYDDIEVGDIADAFVSDETWHGTFHLSILTECSEIECRLMEFITFCKEWHNRLKQDQEYDASEFDSYKDVLCSGLWVAVPVTPYNGAVHQINEAPVFVGDEISWRDA